MGLDMIASEGNLNLDEILQDLEIDKSNESEDESQENSNQNFNLNNTDQIPSQISPSIQTNTTEERRKETIENIPKPENILSPFDPLSFCEKILIAYHS